MKRHDTRVSSDFVVKGCVPSMNGIEVEEVKEYRRLKE